MSNPSPLGLIATSFKCCESCGDGIHLQWSSFGKQLFLSPLSSSSANRLFMNTVLTVVHRIYRSERLQYQFHVQSCPVTVRLEPTETLRVWFSLMSSRVDPQLPYRTLKFVRQHAPLILLSSNWPWNFTYILGEEEKSKEPSPIIKWQEMLDLGNTAVRQNAFKPHGPGRA